MTQYPDVKFKYGWREYQKRVLDELDEHLSDNHLHIIAPPGSGKTVLGLEVALRLNKPTLIFAPTIAIRNQWIQRFCELFLQVDQKPDWISRDIKQPKFLTVITYQSLNAACSGIDFSEEEDSEEEFVNTSKTSKIKSEKEESIITLLQNQNIGTIVVDEAHHLKNAWWQSLTEVKKALNATIVGLTATPPYDVSANEWQRYIELNGPVDAEISVPELVASGDLCPHQDYVYFSRPTLEENQKIKEYRERIQTLYDEIKSDQSLIESLINHPIYSNPKQQLDWIYTNLEYYSATLIFLNEVGTEVTADHLEIIGVKKFVVPKLNFEWLEILLTFYLFKDSVNFKNHQVHQKRLIGKLRRNGAMERSSVKFRYHRKVNSYLTSSTSKLRSIEQIVDFEHKQLDDALRMVVLTDYIRKEFLVNQSVNDLELNKIGVMPIFEKLRRDNHRNIRIGVLTGSLVIIPVSALLAFKTIANNFNIESLSTTELAYDNQYVIVNLTERIKHHIVHIFTQVFQQGSIEVIIGTKSLLGEGWDAPSINSLILASVVGSYVLSNQMRGRAIRTQRQNANKTGNIWHLVCTDPNAEDGGEDLKLLKRRFKAFVGVSFWEEVSIESGIDRLNLSEKIVTETDIESSNSKMLTAAANRDRLKEKWTEALKSGAILIEEIKVPFPRDQDYMGVKSMYYNKTIKHLFYALSSGVIGFGLESLQGLSRVARHVRSTEEMINILMVIGGAGVLLFGRLAFKTFRAYIKYRDISKDIRQIGEALLESLVGIGVIKTETHKLEVVSEVDGFGAIYCHLNGGTTYEKSTFIKSLQEIIGTVNNPRYIIVRKSFFLQIFAQKDFHSVPDIIGQKKKFAEQFSYRWERLVGACQLVYTRNVSGRKLLLKSRIHSLASEFEDKSERISRWR